MRPSDSDYLIANPMLPLIHPMFAIVIGTSIRNWRQISMTHLFPLLIRKLFHSDTVYLETNRILHGF